MTNIVKIAANADGHYLALTDLGTVWAWGTNSTGQLGDGTTIDRSGPVSITSLTNLAAIAAGESHSLAADKNGHVWAWGSDTFGQLGDGLTNVFAAVPQSVLALSNVNTVVVAAGGAHSLALDISGIVWAWGLNTSGQAGNSALTNIALPGTVAGLTNTVVAVSAGYQHSLALGSNGVLWAWGLNDHGQLGNGDTNSTATPVVVTEPPTNVVAVASGDAHSLALDGTGNVWAWGDNTYGQLGNGTNGDQWVPQLVSGFSNDVVAIAASGNLSAALRLDGAVWVWGQCVGSIPGDLTNSGTNVPVQLSGFSMGTWIDSDGDGMPDGWELAHGLNPYDPSDANQDPSGDGMSNLQKYLNGFDPHDYYNGALPALTVTNGNYQSGGTNQFLSQPLVVLVASSNGVALVNAPVTFSVTQGAGLVATTTNGTLGSSVSLTTDANGRAQVWFRLPSTVATTNQITLTAVSGTNTTQATFTVSTQPTGSGSLLPSWWQIQYFGHTGVDPYADPDSDGIYNLQEYLLGTDPTIAEAGPSTNATTVATVSGSQTNTAVGRWVVKGSSIYTKDRRGYVEYTINAPASDIYRLELVGFAYPYVWPTNNYALSIISMDGVCFTQAWLQTVGSLDGVTDGFTPWLTNGPHKVGVMWDNPDSFRSLGIRELRLQTVAGTDANTNGVKDWIEYQLAKRNAVFSNQLTVASCVSPYCLEGKGTYVSMLSLIASTLNVSNAPTILTPRATPNDSWYADVPLSATNTTTVVAAFENGGTISTQQIQWVARNVLDGGTITIRKGDTLLLTAAPVGSTNGMVALALGSSTVSTTPQVPIAYPFNTIGTYTVTGVYTPDQGTPQGASLTVQVVGYTFSDGPYCAVGLPRSWTVSGLPTGAVLTADARLQATDVVSNGTHILSLTIDTMPQRAIAARVSTNGPILDVTMATAFWLYNELQTYDQVIATYPDGSQLVETMLILSPVTKNLSVQVNLVVGGSLFEDGTTIKILTAKDFDALGQVKLRFVMAPGTHTAHCNSIQVFQGTTFVQLF